MRQSAGRTVAALVFFVPVVWSLAATPVSAEPLNEALKQLLAVNPQIKAAERTLRAGGEGVNAARADFLPTLAATGETGYEQIDSPTRRLNQGEASGAGRDSATLSLTQNLFKGFRSSSEFEVAKLRRESLNAELTRTRQNVLYDGANAYLTVLREQRLQDVALRTEHTLDTLLTLERERQRRGGGITVDVLQAQSRLQLARERVTEIRGRLQRALARYLRLFERPANPAEMTMPEAPAARLPATLEDAVGQGRTNNPSLKRSDAEVRTASKQREVERSAYYPSIDLVGEGSWETNVDGVAGTRREQRVMLRGSWDLFDGFLRNARTARASETYGARMNNHTALDREVENRVRDSWVELETARTSETLAQEAVGIAKQVFDARQRLRVDGRETLINVLDAERESNAAEERLITAETESHLAVYRLLRDMGLLSPEALGI